MSEDRAESREETDSVTDLGVEGETRDGLGILDSESDQEETKHLDETREGKEEWEITIWKNKVNDDNGNNEKAPVNKFFPVCTDKVLKFDGVSKDSLESVEGNTKISWIHFLYFV